MKTDGARTGKFRDFGFDLPNGVEVGEINVPFIAMKSMAALLCSCRRCSRLIVLLASS
jgi:hypothetical protein